MVLAAEPPACECGTGGGTGTAPAQEGRAAAGAADEGASGENEGDAVVGVMGVRSGELLMRDINDEASTLYIVAIG
jgi:hypothetical protein